MFFILIYSLIARSSIPRVLLCQDLIFQFFIFENLVTHCIKWLSFRIHNETRHNNVILTEIKNVVVANDVATRTDWIKSKETKIKKTSVSMNVTADDEVNSNKFKKKRNN